MAVVTQATKFKVPREDNTVLIWSTTPILELLQANELTRSTYPDWLIQLTADARREISEHLATVKNRALCCCSCAEQKEGQNGSPQETPSLKAPAEGVALKYPPVDSNQVAQAHWILGGHQPELFHPGVWFKNFYLNKVATELTSQGQPTIGLHLVVDHDLARSTSLRASHIDNARLLPSSYAMPIAKAHAAPWEATYYLESDRTAWEGWVDHLIDDCKSLGLTPIIESRRKEFLELLRETSNISEAFSRFRHWIEKDNGCDNHELAMSQVASTHAFGEFVRRCLLDAKRFCEIYNEARENFRVERDITNPAQPVPELIRYEEWFELPFWVYTKDRQPVQRSKLWCRLLENNQIELADAPKPSDSESTNVLQSHPLNKSDEATSASIRFICSLDEQQWHVSWDECIRSGVCIRPRALTNTLFLRYVVADLFVHGIGGGIYDAVTDEIAHQLWGLKPLAMQVVSASLFLPIGDAVASRLPGTLETNPTLHERNLHRLRSAPETFLKATVPAEAELQRQFEELLANRPAKGNRKAWHISMSKLRQSIRSLISDRESELRTISRSLVEQERQSRILRSRETSFILFPEADITQRLRRLLAGENMVVAGESMGVSESSG